MTFPTTPFPRRLDQAEAFFWLLDRHSSMNFCVIAEGQGMLDSAAIQAALPQLQARHPMLTVAVRQDDAKHLIFAASPEAVPAFSSTESTVEQWRTLLAQTMVQPFALDAAPLFRVHLYRLPDQRWALALTLHHSIGDARSAFPVLAELLQLASGTAPDLPAITPRPPLLALYPPHLQDDAGRAAAEQLKIIKREENKAQGLPASLPGYTEHPLVEAPDFISLNYPADWLEAVGRRAKQAGATLHGVIGAAQLLAVRAQIPGDERLTLSLTTPADLRPTLQPAMDTCTPGFYVTLLSVSFPVGDKADFWSLARDISARNREQYARGDGHLLYHFFPPAQHFLISERGQAAFDEMMRRGPQTSALSNVGRLPAITGLQGISVDHLSFALCPAPKQPIFASAATYDGRLTLNLSYDRKRLPQSLLQAIAQDMDASLRNAAG